MNIKPKVLLFWILTSLSSLNFAVDTDTDTDTDGDGVGDSLDNCKFFINENQTDSDDDGIGNLCDDDGDGDGVREFGRQLGQKFALGQVGDSQLSGNGKVLAFTGFESSGRLIVSDFDGTQWMDRPLVPIEANLQADVPGRLSVALSYDGGVLAVSTAATSSSGVP